MRRSVNFGWAGRTACQASRAWPRTGSTGLVNAVPVLCAGMSSRQTASRARTCCESPGDRGAVVLPADAAHPQPGDLVAALAGEQPGQGDRPHQFQRVEVPGLGLREVAGLQVQPGPHELRPDVVGDHARVGAEQGRDAARDGQCPLRVEAPGDLLPFLQVAEERAEHGEVAGLGGRFQRLAELVLQPGGALDVVAHLHPVDRGDPGGAGLPGPGRGVGGLRRARLPASGRPSAASRGSCPGPGARARTCRASAPPAPPRPAGLRSPGRSDGPSAAAAGRRSPARRRPAAWRAACCPSRRAGGARGGPARTARCPGPPGAGCGSGGASGRRPSAAAGRRRGRAGSPTRPAPSGSGRSRRPRERARRRARPG